MEIEKYIEEYFEKNKSELIFLINQLRLDLEKLEDKINQL